MINKISLYILLLVGCYNNILAQSTFNFPVNYPEAFTEYIYEAKDVKMVTETYEKNVPKVSFPTNANNAKDGNILLDIYYCENNAINFGLKPLIIFSPGGGREKSDYKFIASDLARRGFVTASINVRGNTLNNLQLMFNAKNVNPVLVTTGAMDLHNAINYIIKERASALHVDPNWVIVAGGSLGGAISLQGAFMDKEEANAKFGKNVNNDFFNNYDSNLQKNNIKGVLDFYGAVYDVNFIKPTETKPVFIYHGSADPAVPFMEGNLFYNPIDVYVYGGVRILEKIKDYNSYYFISAKDVGHTLTPQCNYDVNSFPRGYPMNWYPDMLYFVKNAILGNQTIKVIKTVDCVEPECSINKSSCRVVTDDVKNGSKNASNAIIPTPDFNKTTESKLPNVLKSATVSKNSSNSNNVNLIPIKIDHCKAIAFDGNDFIKINNSPSLAVGFDVEYWFKRTSTNTNENVEILFSLGTSNNITNSAFTFGFLGNSKIYVGYNNGNSYIDKTQNIVNQQGMNYAIDNNWHHLHFQLKNGSITGEIDGNKGLFTLSNAIKSSVNTDNTMNTYLGGADFNTGSISYKYNNFIGQLHDVRLWKTGYSFENSTVSSTPSTYGLVAAWKLNTNNQTVVDEGQYKVNGTLGSNNSVEKSDPVFVNNCDGTNITNTIINEQTTAPTTTNTTVITTPKSDTVAVPVVIQDGINIIKTDQKPLIMFNTQKGGKALIKIINSANKLLVAKTVVISKGTNSLFSLTQNLKQGNYTITVTLNSKKYVKKFTVTK